MERSFSITKYFYVKRAPEYHKNEKKFLLPNKMSLLPGKQMLIKNPSQKTKLRKKEKFNFYAVNKIQETIGDVFCPKRKKEMCTYVSTKTAFSFHDSKKGKTSFYVIQLQFKKRKPTLTQLGGIGTYYFAK